VQGWVSEMAGEDVRFCAVDEMEPELASSVPVARRVSPVPIRRRTSGAAFECLNRAPVRTGFDMLSERAGFVEAGETVAVLEIRQNEKGQRQLRLDAGWVMEYGWTGTRMFAPAEDEGSSDSSVGEAVITLEQAREIQRRSASRSPTRRSRSPSPPARRPVSAGRERVVRRAGAGARSVSAGRRRVRRLSAVGGERPVDDSTIDGAMTEARAREYIAGMLGVSTINDGHVDKAMAMAAEGGVANAAQRSRVQKLRGRSKVRRHDIAAIWVAFFSRCQRYLCRQVVTAYNILQAAGSVQRRRSRRTIDPTPTPPRKVLSPNSRQRFVSRMQNDASERAEYRQRMRVSYQIWLPSGLHFLKMPAMSTCRC